MITTTVTPTKRYQFQASIYSSNNMKLKKVSCTKLPYKNSLHYTNWRLTISAYDLKVFVEHFIHVFLPFYDFFFLTFFTKGNNFSDFLSASLDNLAPSKMGYTHEIICSQWNKFVPLRADHYWSDRQKRKPHSYFPWKYSFT